MTNQVDVTPGPRVAARVRAEQDRPPRMDPCGPHSRQNIAGSSGQLTLQPFSNLARRVQFGCDFGRGWPIHVGDRDNVRPDSAVENGQESALLRRERKASQFGQPQQVVAARRYIGGCARHKGFEYLSKDKWAKNSACRGC